MSRSATTLNVVLKLNTPQALIAFLTARSEISRMYAVDNEALVRSNELKSNEALVLILVIVMIHERLLVFGTKLTIN